MKILVDARLLVRGGVSGIEEYTRNLLQSFLAIDQNNEYIFFYNGFRKQPLKEQFQVSGIKYQVIDWKIPNKLLDFSARFFNWPKIDNLIKCDLIFSPHFNTLAIERAPRIITFHDLSFLHHPYFFSRKQKIWHWLQNAKKQASRADRIIAVSESTKQDLINSFGMPDEKIQVIYSGISEDFKSAVHFQPTTELIKQPYILYLGTLEPRKNVPAIIKAFNILKDQQDFKDFKLVLAGRWGWLYDNILKEAHRSFYREDIVFWGAVSHLDKIKLYNGAKVFVYPSFFEGFGFPPLEAQACSCPVIVSRRTSLPEMLGDSALYVDPWKVGDLAEKMKQLISDNGLRTKLILAGLENAKRFSWQNTARQTLNLFNTFI